MSEHLVHLLFLGLLLSLSFGILFKDRLQTLTRSSVLVLIFVAVFIASHVSCCDLSVTLHHDGTQPQTSYHSCCLGQVAMVNPVVSFKAPNFDYTSDYLNKQTLDLRILSYSLQNKSPPV